MDQAGLVTAIFSGFVAATMIGFFVWGLLNGQFKNVQDTSRRMLQNNLQPPRKSETESQTKENRQGGEKE